MKIGGQGVFRPGRHHRRQSRTDDLRGNRILAVAGFMLVLLLMARRMRDALVIGIIAATIA